MDLFVLAIPLFLISVLVEWFLSVREKVDIGNLPDALSNLSCGILQELVAVVFKGFFGVGYLALYSPNPFHLRAGLVTWSIALVGVDLCYYCFHRASHRINFLWATHIVHHSSEEYNLTVALRQSALGGFFSWIFYLPLALIGTPPEIVAGAYFVNLLYQFFIHTKLVGKLGPVEWIFNTPSHHRVHHGTNQQYLDKNYAGILIIWDRLFRSFEPEVETPRYGITEPLRSWNPVWANLHYWRDLWRNGIEYFWKTPEEMPEGPRLPVPSLELSASIKNALLCIYAGTLTFATCYFLFCNRLSEIAGAAGGLMILILLYLISRLSTKPSAQIS